MSTKLFHTAEGGASVTRDEQLQRQIDLLRNFGIKNETTVLECGINGKMSQLHAALGLCAPQPDRKRARYAARVCGGVS